MKFRISPPPRNSLFFGVHDIGKRISNPTRVRLALVSASGTPMVTNLSFLQFRALGTSKIGFLGEKRFILTGAMFPNVENTIY